MQDVKYHILYFYHFFKLVKLVKNFNTTRDAKDWFIKTYILANSSILLRRALSKETYDDEDAEDDSTFYWPPHFEKLDFNNRIKSVRILSDSLSK